MINRLIEWSLRNRFRDLCGLLLLVGWGSHAVYRTLVDATSDLRENQVIVFADWPGRSPQEVEDQVTYPLSVDLQGLAGVKFAHARSMFGFAFITVIFQDSVDKYSARTRALERLDYLGDLLPAGVVPKLGPDATRLGWVYQNHLAVDPAKAAPGGDLSQLHSLQDWFIHYQLNAVSGVAEIECSGAAFGSLVTMWECEGLARRADVALRSGRGWHSGRQICPAELLALRRGFGVSLAGNWIGA
jgi:Cu(I)/Ag(I) efflux system membrane protein CusA/SilA